jgi:AraC-like DNA-binding protein
VPRDSLTPADAKGTFPLARPNAWASPCGASVNGAAEPGPDRGLGFEVAHLEANPGPRPRPSHRHDHYQIVWVAAGSGLHVIDWHLYPVRGSTVFFLTPSNLHFWSFRRPAAKAGTSTRQVRWPFRGYVLNFDAAFVASLATHDAQKVLMPGLFGPGRQPALYLDRVQSRALQRVVSSLDAEYRRDEVGSTSAIAAHFQLLLVQLNRFQPAARGSNGSTPGEVLVRQFRVLVDRQFRQRTSLQEYAKRLKVSEGHLNRIVRRHTGTTANNLIHERVLVEAKRALVHLDSNIAEIAASLGFEDPAYFARLFKKDTGQTPRAFRAAFDHALRAHAAVSPHGSATQGSA